LSIFIKDVRIIAVKPYIGQVIVRFDIKNDL